ncbi:aldolase [Sphingomonas sp. HHU CXW]|uniref:Aldolase n=2 Tax=Sphingomonas hominis TaxID=2741495 RepID=A0ABX2JGP8_9SPHN|nr:aldolase [Sphingomonas hominis]
MLLGSSGAGKSDLALRLIDRGALLVSDDYTQLVALEGKLIATPPATIAGRMEIRGIGIVVMPFTPSITVRMVVGLGDEVDRMPRPSWRTIADQRVRAIVIDPRAPSAAIKVERALAQFLAECGA